MNRSQRSEYNRTLRESDKELYVNCLPRHAKVRGKELTDDAVKQAAKTGPYYQEQKVIVRLDAQY